MRISSATSEAPIITGTGSRTMADELMQHGQTAGTAGTMAGGLGAAAGGTAGAAAGGLVGWGVGMAGGALVGLVTGMFLAVAMMKGSK
jgi:hypothetical protein